MVVWARDTSDGAVKGFLIEKGTPGYNARVMGGKASLRAVWQAEIELDGVRVPAEHRLPGANSFKDCAAVMTGTHSACAWMARGHAVSGFDAALTYAKRRKQFGKPLASFQLIQQRLVRMLAEVTAMQTGSVGQHRAHEDPADRTARWVRDVNYTSPRPARTRSAPPGTATVTASGHRPLQCTGRSPAGRHEPGQAAQIGGSMRIKIVIRRVVLGCQWRSRPGVSARVRT